MVTQVTLSPLLTFVSNGLNVATCDQLMEACVGFYALSELNNAKDLLWSCADNDVLGKNTRRRESTRSKEEPKIASDIIQGMMRLDAKGKMPTFAVDALGLNRVPKLSPEKLSSNFSVLERLQYIEERMETMQKQMSKAKEYRPSYAEAATHAVQNAMNDQHREPPSWSMGIPPADRDTRLKGVWQPGDKSRMTRDHQDSEGAHGYKQDRRGRRKRHMIVGTAEPDSRLKAAPKPNRSIHVSGLTTDANENMVMTYLVDKGIQPEKVEQLVRNGVPTRNYRVEITASAVPSIMRPDTWPKGVSIRPFFQARSRIRTSSRQEEDNALEKSPDISVEREDPNACDDMNNQLKTPMNIPLNASENGSEH